MNLLQIQQSNEQIKQVKEQLENENMILLNDLKEKEASIESLKKQNNELSENLRGRGAKFYNISDNIIDNLIPSHLNEYIELKRQFLYQKNENQELKSTLNKQKTEFKLLSDEVQQKLPCLELRKKQYEDLLIQSQILKTKLESQLQISSNLNERIKVLEQENKQQSITIDALNQVVASQLEEISKLLNTNIDTEGDQKSKIDQIVEDKYRLTLELNRLKNDSSQYISLVNYQEVKDQLRKVQIKLSEREKEIKKFEENFARIDQERMAQKTIIEGLEQINKQISQSAYVEGIQMKQIQKIKKTNDEKEKVQLQLRQNKIQIRKYKFQIEELEFQLQKQQQLIQLDTSVKLQQEENIKQLTDKIISQTEEINQLKGNLQQSEREKLIQKQEYELLLLRFGQIESANIYKEKMYTLILEKNRMVSNQQIEIKTSNKELNDEIKKLNGDILENKKIQRDQEIEISNLQKQLLQVKQNSKSLTQIQLENQKIINLSLKQQCENLENQIKQLQLKILDQNRLNYENVFYYSFIQYQLIKQLKEFINKLEEVDQKPSEITVNNLQFENIDESIAYFESVQQQIYKQRQEQIDTIKKQADQINQMKQINLKENTNLQNENKNIKEALEKLKQKYEKDQINSETKLRDEILNLKDQLQDVQTQRNRYCKILSKQQAQEELMKQEKEKFEEKIKEFEQKQQEIQKFQRELKIQQEIDLLRFYNIELSLRSSEYIPQRQVIILKEQEAFNIREITRLTNELNEQKYQNTLSIKEIKVDESQPEQKDFEQKKKENIESSEEQIKKEISNNNNNNETFLFQEIDQLKRENLSLMETIEKYKLEEIKCDKQLSKQNDMEIENENEKEELLNQIEKLKWISDGLNIEEVEVIKKMIIQGKLLNYLEKAKIIFEQQQISKNLGV